MESSPNPEKIISCDGYIIKIELGQGSYARVYLAELESKSVSESDNHKKRFAIKILNSNEDSVAKEAEYMNKFNHSRIVKLISFNQNAKCVVQTQDQEKKIIEKPILVMESCENGRLFDFIIKKKISENVAFFYFKQLLEAIEECHKNGIAHRDLKPENILLDTDFNLKIIDFGTATFFKEGDILQESPGTPLYWPPEVSEGSYEPPKYDIFVCGFILFMLLFRIYPCYESADDFDPYFKWAIKGDWNKYWGLIKKSSSELIQNLELLENEKIVRLLESLLESDPEKRAKIEDLKKNELLKSIPSDAKIDNQDAMDEKQPENYIEKSIDVGLKKRNSSLDANKIFEIIQKTYPDSDSESRNLEQMYGDYTPLDISLKDFSSIEGLKAVLYACTQLNDTEVKLSEMEYEVFLDSKVTKKRNVVLKLRLYQINEKDHIIRPFQLGGSFQDYAEVYSKIKKTLGVFF